MSPKRVVMGERKRRSFKNLSSEDCAEKASRSSQGKTLISVARMNLARALFQKGVRGKISCHHACQRLSVFRLAPNICCRTLAPTGVGPWRMAVRRMTRALR